jgi:anti-anti-sigma factor
MPPSSARSRIFHHVRWDGHGLTVSVAAALGSRATLRLTGELDLASAAAFAACIDGQLAEGRQHLKLDLSGLDFIDATGLAAVVKAHHQLLDARGSLVIEAMSRRCRRLVEMVGLDHTLLIADQAAGIKSFSAAGLTAMLMGSSAK